MDGARMGSPSLATAGGRAERKARDREAARVGDAGSELPARLALVHLDEQAAPAFPDLEDAMTASASPL